GLAVAAALIIAPLTSSADILYQNSLGPDLNGGDPSFTTIDGGTNQPVWLGENFTLGSTALVQRIAFNGHHNSATGDPVSIEWAIRKDDGSTLYPGALVTGATALTFSKTETFADPNDTAFEYQYYNIDVSVQLDPGLYWLTFHVNTAEGDPEWTLAMDLG